MDLLGHLDRQEPRPRDERDRQAEMDALRAEYARLITWQAEAQRVRDYERAAMMRGLAVDLQQWMVAYRAT